MARLTELRFDNSYARLHPAFYEVVDPAPLPDPYLVTFNPAAAELLDLDPSEGGNPALVEYLGGVRRLPGSEPLAQAYAGHQFGVWVPQLGDGRAFLLGEVRNARGESWDLHLKGGGRTRFSRFGDGRAVLRSTIREYLACEALHGLGIPTTRALAIIGSDLPVQRERIETAATLLRLSPSHVRFGTFQYFAARGEVDRVRELADYLIGRHLRVLLKLEGPDRYAAWFGEVCRSTARLLAQWMAVGFAHGVMNTDNMSVLGLTLDYGPYGFLDEYDAGFICNHTDSEGRYAFNQQPGIALWNCARFGEALMVLGESERWQTELDSYWEEFLTSYRTLLLAKLGLRDLAGAAPDTAELDSLISDLLKVLQAERTDYTLFFRMLSEEGGTGHRSIVGAGCSGAMQAWLACYTDRLRAEGGEDAERADGMRRVNPKYVLRNWIAQEAIAEAQAGRFELIEELRVLFADPFGEHPGMERFAEPPTAAAREIAVSCSS